MPDGCLNVRPEPETRYLSRCVARSSSSGPRGSPLRVIRLGLDKWTALSGPLSSSSMV